MSEETELVGKGRAIVYPYVKTIDETPFQVLRIDPSQSWVAICLDYRPSANPIETMLRFLLVWAGLWREPITEYSTVDKYNAIMAYLLNSLSLTEATSGTETVRTLLVQGRHFRVRFVATDEGQPAITIERVDRR